MTPTSVNINVEMVRQLLMAQFPHWANLPIKPVEFDGWDNRTFHLGDAMSVRLPSAEWYAAQVDKEHLWLPKLAPFLPLPIPVPLAKGDPSDNYLWHWSVYRWLEGETATVARIADGPEFAITLAQFLIALQEVNPAGGPHPGEHNFYRGGSLKVYDNETRHSIITLSGQIDTKLATEVWEAAIHSTWQTNPVWVHGDIAIGNLLVNQGRLHAVIDFGCCAVGDPACDLTMAWTFFSGTARDAFFAALPLDEGVWARARGWALWKALITLAEYIETNRHKARNARHVIDQVLDDYLRAK